MSKYPVLVAAETELLNECDPLPAIVDIVPVDIVTLRIT